MKRNIKTLRQKYGKKAMVNIWDKTRSLLKAKFPQADPKAVENYLNSLGVGPAEHGDLSDYIEENELYTDFRSYLRNY